MLYMPRILRLPTKLRRRARRSRMATLFLLFALLALLVLPFYVVYRPPHSLIRYFAHRWPDVLWEVPLPPPARGDPGPKLVALTIDDAPSDHTPLILAQLAAHGAHATFFVIGSQVPGREAVLADIVRAGHELANHAMRDEPSRALADDELARQIKQVGKYIEKAYQDAVRTPLVSNVGEKAGEAVQKPPGLARPPTPGLYFRPGSGFFSKRMRALTARLKYRIVLGSIYPHDPQVGYWWINARHILSMLRPGAIIICHDRRSWTAPMLKKVLPSMVKKGYRAVTVTELLEAAKGR